MVNCAINYTNNSLHFKSSLVSVRKNGLSGPDPNFIILKIVTATLRLLHHQTHCKYPSKYGLYFRKVTLKTYC